MNSSALQSASLNRAPIAAFTSSTVRRAARGAEELARGVHARLGRTLCTAHPDELVLVLHPATSVEELAVGCQLDPAGAQASATSSGNPLGTTADPTPSA